MHELIWGLIIALGLIALSVTLRKYIQIKLIAATVLTAIAFIYIGFSLEDNTIYHIALETFMAVLFSFLSMIGFSHRKALLGYGIILHGVWDILHHNGSIISTNIPFYWPMFCLTVDVVYGMYIVFYFKRITHITEHKMTSRISKGLLE